MLLWEDVSRVPRGTAAAGRGVGTVGMGATGELTRWAHSQIQVKHLWGLPDFSRKIWGFVSAKTSSACLAKLIPTVA